jgi:hypothetical protein
MGGSPMHERVQTVAPNGGTAAPILHEIVAVIRSFAYLAGVVIATMPSEVRDAFWHSLIK